jgi:putative ABC transport system substrate-binding protein
MRRRDIILALGGAAAWPLAARAQQPSLPVIGFLSSSSPALFAARLNAFRQGLAEADYAEGRNVTLDYRWAEGRNDRLNDFAIDLVRRPVSTILASGEPAVFAAKAATATIPVVFVGGSDPVHLGLVASLSRPGGNVTGATVLNATMASKRLQLLKELIPTATRIAALFDPASPSSAVQSKDLMQSASGLGAEIAVVHANTMTEVEAAFQRLAEQGAGAVLIGSSARFNAYSESLGALSIRHQIPAIYQTREFAAGGGLASYGASIPDAYRIAGVYTGRILKGEQPADLPVQQATRVEMFINLETARKLGLSVSLPLLARADEVIE